MKKVKFHDKEQVTQADLAAIAQLVQNSGLAQLVQHLILGANKVLDGLKVSDSAPDAMTVDVATGVGYHEGIPIIGDSTTVAIAPADPTYDRIDVVAIGYAAVDSTSVQRTFWNPVTEAEYNQEVYIRELDGFEVVVVAGTPSADPSPPTEYNGEPITDNYLILAEVYVGAGVTEINSGDITDMREIFAATSGYLKWFHSGVPSDDYIEGNGWPVPEDCVALALMVFQETKCTVANPDGDVYTVRKNGVDTELEVKINSSSSNPEKASGFVEFDEGDLLGIYGVPDSASPGSHGHVSVLLGKKAPAVNLNGGDDT
ncbi:MAG: hypothetical protein PVH29_12320 [Candidatus Zixiibacteriota bacterium]|jgi:uncharacterized alkaline shock family protein YloU